MRYLTVGAIPQSVPVRPIEWGAVAPRYVSFINPVVITEEFVPTEAMLAEELPTMESGDRLPRVVAHRGTFYVVDGGAYVLRLKLDGRKGFDARVMDL